MTYLIGQILFCLLLAFLLGLAIGLLLGKFMFATDTSGLERERDDARNESTQGKTLLAAANSKVEEATSELDSTRVSLVAMTAERDAALAKDTSSDLEHLRLKHDVLVQRLREAEQALTACKERYSTLREQSQDSITPVAAIPAADVGALEVEVTSLRARGADLEGKLVELEGTIVGLRSELAGLVPSEPIKPDNLKKIEGIGPKIQGLLNSNGVFTFRQLAAADVDALKGFVMQGGKHMKVHDPGTWPRQAALAADGDWEALKALQDELSGGR